jgi:5-enolpyruvylshikimate-3-phosphate synthase
MKTNIPCAIEVKVKVVLRQKKSYKIIDFACVILCNFGLIIEISSSAGASPKQSKCFVGSLQIPNDPTKISTVSVKLQ